MSFTDEERKKLLAARGVGKQTVARLEAIGVKSFADLRRRNAEKLALQFAVHADNSMFANCPLIRKTLKSAVRAAKQAKKK